jgi:RNA polymerase sigma-70 factor (ECF subfamily)
VDVVRQGNAGARRSALDALLARYLPALRAYLVIGRRMPGDRAADLLQSFVADKIVERDLIARAQRSRGKLRTYLLTALERFAIDAARRQGLRPDGASLQFASHAAAPAAGPSHAFDREWAIQVIGHTIERMESHCRQWGRTDLWEVFKGRVINPSFEGAPATPYEELSPRFGYTSNDQAANALVTAKRLFGRLLREAIWEYASDSADVEEEIRDLRAALAGTGAGGDLMSL